MQSKSERFEMRVGQDTLASVDEWRGRQDDFPSRAEAFRHLVERGLGVSGSEQLKLSDGDKLSLLMLCNLYKHLGISGEFNPEFIEAAIIGGHHWALKWEYSGIFHGHEDDERTVSEVVDVLDMWSFIESAYGTLSKKDKDRVELEAEPRGKHVVFLGFDGNNEREHLNIANFLVRDLERFSFLKKRDLNSHHPSIEMHRRMLPVFEPMRRTFTGGELSVVQIIELMKARVHPEHRES